METILTNEFCELQHITEQQVVLMKWLPDNRWMSETDFYHQIKALSFAVKKHKPIAIYVDAYEFNYPIFENTKRLFDKFLNDYSFILFGIVNSQYLMGELGIQLIVKNSSCNFVRINLFKSRKDGEQWLKELAMMN